MEISKHCWKSEDFATRGLEMTQKEKVRKWFLGTWLLWEEEIAWLQPRINIKSDRCDPEIRNQTRNLDTNKKMIHCHLWSKQQTAEKNEKNLGLGDTFSPESKGENSERSISQILQHQMLRMVQHQIVRMVQHHVFWKRTFDFRFKWNIWIDLLTKAIDIYLLDRFIDEYGLLRVGGRLKLVQPYRYM